MRSVLFMVRVGDRSLFNVVFCSFWIIVSLDHQKAKPVLVHFSKSVVSLF